MIADVRPFVIDVPGAVLDDLAARLANTRWPDRELVDDWSQGAPLSYVKELAEYWATAYEWRGREARLNRFAQFVTPIDGVDIHFVHHRSPHPNALPLLVTHGWPSSIVEFHKVIEPLTDPTISGDDPADAFHVVAPSLPGYGFSGKPTTLGWNPARIATAWATLMARLGYTRYVAHGGDWGAAVTASLGAGDPSRCAAIHLTMAIGSRPTGEPATPEARLAIERRKHYDTWDGGYGLQQRSRPQTLGYGLADSPVAQLAWIVEKYWSWTDNDGHPENVLSRDEMLDNVMIYWCSNVATSSARLYWEHAANPAKPIVDVPTGFSVFPREVVPPVREWIADQYRNITSWRTHDRGGHFPALEVPATLVADLRDWARAHR